MIMKKMILKKQEIIKNVTFLINLNFNIFYKICNLLSIKKRKIYLLGEKTIN